LNSSPSPFPPGFQALVVGASRGIGLALTRALLDRSDCGRVFAARRSDTSGALDELAATHGERLHVVRVDVSDADTLRAAAGQIRERTAALHLLINTAGVLHESGTLRPERRLEDLRPDTLRRSFEVNAFGPILLAQNFAPLLTHEAPAVFASLSARVGSIADNRLGGWYAYRASKAAQNQFLRTLAVEMARRAPRLRVLALHPGTVDTDLSKPFQAGVAPDKLFEVTLAAQQLLHVIETSTGTGRFLAWDGAEIPW
jgi:NAD(P)-dependent dehydrogenase (short-subunit alcohol dehydrogenase family)